MADQSNRTEQPTPRRLDKARRDGNIPTSKEFVSGVSLVLFIWLLDTFGVRLMSEARYAVRELLYLQAEPLGVRDLGQMSAGMMYRRFFWVLMPVLAFLGVTVLSHLAAAGFNLSWAKARPDISRLNSLNRLGQMPGQNVRSFAIATLLLLLGLYVFWQLVTFGWLEATRMMRMSLRQQLVSSKEFIMSVVWKGGLLLLLIGCVDLYRQRRKWWSQLRMTKQEVREEHKEMEGNPLIRTRIRRLQREATRKRMMQDVPKATAVVVNPTHYAVALRYQIEGMGAPRVVAKGRNWQALRIRELAIRHEVPIVENPPLARALYASAEVGQEIPSELYQAVAEILAYIYRLLGGRLPGSERTQ